MAPRIFSINKNGEKIDYDVILTFKSEINNKIMLYIQIILMMKKIN